jgi:hypothetical protein
MYIYYLQINESTSGGEMDAERQAHAMADPEIQVIITYENIKLINEIPILGDFKRSDNKSSIKRFSRKS